MLESRTVEETPFSDLRTSCCSLVAYEARSDSLKAIASWLMMVSVSELSQLFSHFKINACPYNSGSVCVDLILSIELSGIPSTRATFLASSYEMPRRRWRMSDDVRSEIRAKIMKLCVYT